MDDPKGAIDACLLGRGSTAAKVKEIHKDLRDKFQLNSLEPRMHLYKNRDAILQEVAQDEH